MHVGCWIDEEGIEGLEKYKDSSELRSNIGHEDNIIAVDDKKSNKMILIVSGMFPFSTMPDSQVKELIDYTLFAKGMIVKKLNFVSSKLSQIQLSRKGRNKDTALSVENRKNLANSILEILSPDVLEGTKVDYAEFTSTLNSIVEKRNKGVSTYLNNIKSKLYIYYVDYIESLISYFNKWKQYTFADDSIRTLANTASEKLTEIKDTESSLTDVSSQFLHIVTELGSASKFQGNAYKLVHTEDILLYCVEEGKIVIYDEGIRFFTKYDMCETCEHIVWIYSHKDGSTTPFIVLSKDPYHDSRSRNNTEENILLKAYIRF